MATDTKMDKPVEPAVPPPPKSAGEALARVDEDHQYTLDQIDMNSTGGIQRAIKRSWHGIEALANYIDGVKGSK